MRITAYVPDRVSTAAVGLLAEVFAAHPPDGIPAFDITFCAEVERVEVSDAQPEGLSGFEIR